MQRARADKIVLSWTIIVNNNFKIEILDFNKLFNLVIFNVQEWAVSTLHIHVSDIVASEPDDNIVCNPDIYIFFINFSISISLNK